MVNLAKFCCQKPKTLRATLIYGGGGGGTGVFPLKNRFFILSQEFCPRLWNKVKKFPLPRSIRNSLIEAALVIIRRSLSTVLLRICAKLFEASSLCNSSYSSVSSVLQGTCRLSKYHGFTQPFCCLQQQ